MAVLFQLREGVLIRKWAGRVAAAALVLAVLLAAAAAVFLERPGLLLTSRSAGLAVEFFGASYSPRWSSLEFEAAAVGRRRHRYALRAEEVCAGNAFAKGCFKRIALSVVIRYTRKGPRVELLEELTAAGGAVSVDLRRRPPGAAAKEARFDSPKANQPSAGILATPVRAVNVRIPEFVLRAETYELEGGLAAALNPAARRPVSLEADLTARGTGATRRVKAEVTAATDLFKGVEPTFIDASARAEVRGLGRARGEVRARRAGDRYEGSGEAELIASTGPLRGARLSACRGAGNRSFAEASCRFAMARFDSPKANQHELFGEINTAAGRLNLTSQVRGGRLKAALTANLDPVTQWYEVSGGLEASLAGRLDRPLSAMTLRHEARLAFKARFEKLVEVLRGTRYAVPAPVHVLSGPVTLSLDSRGDPRADRLSVRYVLTTALAGTRQRLTTHAEGLLTTSRRRTAARLIEHTGTVLLKEVALELPRLEVGPAPKVAVDKRIRPGAAAEPAAAAAPARAPALRSRVAIRTEKPLILFSNLAKEPVPAALDLVATYPPAAVGGGVAVRKFAVELFRRSATVDHFNISVSSASTVAGLEGLLLYQAPSAVISIRILGTTARPRVELSSVPPLKREDIIALLIFGKSPAELDPEQTASVSNTETALESRAFGLASLYLFGSTPIEHVGYDSASRTASVKLRLPGGANLTLGSDFDQSRQLSVRKPLAPHWALQSEITEQGEQSRAATTFLEWFNRY